MPEQRQIYKCETCGNIVEVLKGGQGDLICCGESMQLLSEKSEEEGQEKHLPVIEKTEHGFKVKVGSVPHPMEENHYIEWIELIAGDKAYRQFLNPGDAPEAFFAVDADQVSAREFCNIHGLWRS